MANYVDYASATELFTDVGNSFTAIEGKIPSNASSSNKMVTASDIATKADLVDGKVPSSQLPSYVDDVLEYASTSQFPATGESGKIYVATDTNKTYRWGGSDYVEISESLALGETSSTAYAGNKGKANADAISAINDLIPSGATTSNKLATASDIPDTSGLQPKTLATTIGSYTTVEGALSGINDGKVDKVTGKGLSTNDYTDADQTALQTTIPLEISQLQGSMLTKANTTYVDAEIEQVYADNGVLGAKNLLKYPYCITTRTSNNITFTDNGDGTITLSTPSGQTASADTYFNLIDWQVANNIGMGSIIGQTLLVSGGINDNVILKVNNKHNNDTGNVGVNCKGTEVPISIYNESDVKIYASILILNGTDLSTPITIKPMLRLATDPDSTYAPYAMTNRELTETISTEDVAYTAGTGITLATDENKTRCVRSGNIVSLSVAFKNTEAQIDAFTTVISTVANEISFNAALNVTFMGMRMDNNSAVPLYAGYSTTNKQLYIQSRANIPANVEVRGNVVIVL